jgi:hypothetical protein
MVIRLNAKAPFSQYGDSAAIWDEGRPFAHKSKVNWLRLNGLIPLSAAVITIAFFWSSVPDANARQCNDFLPGKAYQSDAVVDQVGVNVHIGFFNTPYKNFDGLVVPVIKDLGVRYMRDSAVTDFDANHIYVDRLARLAKIGIRFSLIAFDDTQPAHRIDPKKLGELRKRIGGALEIIEGTNEPNLKSVPSWSKISRVSQTALYEAVAADPALRGVFVAGPSPWGKTAGEIGDISALVDFGNWHTYSGGQYPEWFGMGSITDYVSQARKIFANKPILVTEDGYHSALLTKKSHRPAPEDVIARYLPRVVLSHLECGIVRTYFYELIDSFQRGPEDPESNFGLVRANGDRKPGFESLKKLIATFNDPGPSFKPEYFQYSLTATSKTTNIKSMQFRKRDGSVLIAIWLGVSSWDPDARRPIPVKGLRVTVAAPSVRLWPIRIIRFIESGKIDIADIKTDAEGELQIEVDDQLTILKFLPSK